MDLFFKYLVIFALGAIVGWIIEVIYRNIFFKQKKFFNPGFMHGPYLPIYGSGLVVLYFLSGLNIELYIKFIIIAAMLTFIELVTGLYLLYVKKFRLWDYRGNFLNFKGVICPLYSFYWIILAALFYYTIYPFFDPIIIFFYSNITLLFIIGVFYGIYIVDWLTSIELSYKIKAAAKNINDKKFVLSYQRLKYNISNNQAIKSKSFLKKITALPKSRLLNKFKGIGENLEEYVEGSTDGHQNKDEKFMGKEKQDNDTE